MSYSQSVWLGAVQGLTEFLPVSSSGHLVVVERLFFLSRGSGGIEFEVLLHLGTLLSLLLFFGIFSWRRSKAFMQQGWTFGAKLALGCVPAGVVFLLWGERVEAAFSSLGVVLGGFVFTGAVLFLADRRQLQAGRIEVRWMDSMIIGTAQAVALLPGVSRSGMTLASGLLLGLEADLAVSFSFLLAIPAILGANVFHASSLAAVFRSGQGTVYAAGATAAFVVGVGSIAMVYAIAHRARLKAFSYYLWALVPAVLIWDYSFSPS